MYCWLSVVLPADGNYCITCGADKTIKLWNPHKLEDSDSALLLKTYSGHGYEVIDARCSCDSSQLCSCSLDKTVFLWDVATGKITNKYRGHAGTLSPSLCLFILLCVCLPVLLNACVYVFISLCRWQLLSCMPQEQSIVSGCMSVCLCNNW